MKHLIRALILFLLLGAVFYGGALNRATIDLSSNLMRAFSLPYLYVRLLLTRADIYGELAGMSRENRDLRARVLALSSGVAPEKPGFLPAKVLLAYPFNNKSRVTISAGTGAGVKEGAAVFVSENIFLGQVIKTGDKWGEVATVFDENRKLPVKIGEAGVAGLLQGGSELTVGLIGKSKKIKPGDVVYLASRDLPYGPVVGEISSVREDQAGSFLEAEVAAPYDPRDLNEVLVSTR